MCLAIALKWIGALVDPPIAELTTMTFSNASRVMILEGRRSSHTMSTMRLPVRYAICARSLCGAGMAEQPGSDMTSASASEVMVDAVTLALQMAGLGAGMADSSLRCSHVV